MATPRQKPAEGYRMRNTATGQVVELSPAEAMRGMNTFAPNSALPMFEPVGEVPGFLFKNDGGVVATVFDPKTAIHVARRQGQKDYPLRLSFGKEDPGYQAAQVYQQDQVLRQVGKNKSFFEVAGERAADVATFGMYGALADDSPEEAQVRAYQNLYHPFATTVGTFGGIGAGLLFPYGRMAQVLGKGAMAAGRASGLVRSAQIGKAATGAVPANLLQASARATQATREALKAAGRGTFVQNYVGGLAGAAVAEAPLSLAVAAADIVDYNKDFSAQALIADAGAMFLIGMGLSGAVGLVGAGARAGLGGVRRSTMDGRLSKAGLAVVDWADAATRRASYIGSGPGAGAAKYGIARRGFQWLRRKMGGRTARLLTGEASETFYYGGRTIREVGEGLDVMANANMSKVAQVEALTDSLRAALELAPPHTAAIVDDLIRVAPEIINARQSLGILSQKTLPRYQDALRRLNFRPPKGITFRKGATENSMAMVRGVREELLDEAAQGGVFAQAQKDLAGRFTKIHGEMGKSPQATLRKLVEAREAVAGSGLTSSSRYIEQIDEAIKWLTNGDQRVFQQLHDLERFRAGVGKLTEFINEIGDLRNFTGGEASARAISRELTQMADAAESMGLSKSLKKQLLDDAGVMQQDTTITRLEGLSQLNTLRRSILENAEPGYSAMFKSPITKSGPLSWGDELLDAQIKSVADFKMKTGQALRYLVLSGSPRGFPIGFGGVLTYREMSRENKRQEFSEIYDALREAAASPERILGVVGETSGTLTSTDLMAGVSYATTLTTAASYLASQFPKSSDPIIEPEDFSMEEIDSALELVGALEQPASVIASGRDGSISIEAVDALRTVYPELYADMVLDTVEFLQTKDAQKLTETQLLALDTFTGGALGVLHGWSPMPQPMYAQTPMQQQALGSNLQQGSPDMARMQAKQTSTSSQKVAGL